MEVCCAGGRKEFEVSMPVLVAGPDGKKKVWDTWNCGCGKVQFTIDEPPFCPLIDRPHVESAFFAAQCTRMAPAVHGSCFQAAIQVDVTHVLSTRRVQ